MAKTTQIAVVSSPGFSHLVPLVEFSKRLVQRHPYIHVTCIIPTLESPPNSSKAYLRTLPSNIDSIFLPPIDKEDLPQEAYTDVLIQLTITRSLPSLKKVLKSLSSKAPLAALIIDVFASEALDVAKEFNTLSYIYLSSSAMTLSVLFYIPKLDLEVSGEYKDLTETIKIPGCVSLLGRDLPSPTQHRSSESYKQFLQLCKRMSIADGILLNTFLEMEADAIRALAEKGSGNPIIYPVGPITQIGSSNEANGSECLRWLDNQPPSSVLFVSFGSGGTLPQEQINELALGLELSGQKFLWVLRAPSNSTDAAYLGATNEDPLQFLPCGFLERTKEQGLVVPSWAPQVEVLGHNSVGGFLSHCGWNSTLESVQAGVPLITWPLFAEQRINAKMLTDSLEVAMRLKVSKDDIVGKEDIAKVIKCLMEEEEGKGMRQRIKDLKEAAFNALREDGSSTQTLSQLASKWTNFGWDLGK